jgi:hypothetical protein
VFLELFQSAPLDQRAGTHAEAARSKPRRSVGFARTVWRLDYSITSCATKLPVLSSGTTLPP